MRAPAAQLARTLGLEPHPEGGFFRETYRAEQTVQTARGQRAACTAILFLVTADEVSRLHRLASDELWVFQAGVPLELDVLTPDGLLERRKLGDPGEPGLPVGSDGRGETGVPQALVPAGCWQGARVAGGPHLPNERVWSLVTCVVSPGFAYDDFEMGERAALLTAYPQHEKLILSLT